MRSDSVVLLHVSIISPVDLGRLQRELYNIDIALQSKQDTKSAPIRISRQLDNLVKSTGIDLSSSQHRQQLGLQLKTVRRTAPVVSMVFANNPDETSLSMLVKWFREFGHPNTLIDVSVNPSIGGGCLVRTATKSFDFSIANKLRKSPIKLTR